MKKSFLGLCIASLISFNSVYADDIQSQLDAQQRSMLALQNSIQSLQDEIQSLNGQIEELRHEIVSLKNDNTDLKTRLVQLNTADVKPQQTEQVQGDSSKTDSDQKEKTDTRPQQEQKADNKLKDVSAEAKSEYDQAYSMIEKNNLQGAAKAFASYVSKYPDNKMTPNAWYWLGQVQYKQKDYDAARASFLNSASYKDSAKRADSLYKLGMITLEKGDREKAKRYFEIVVKTYPQDTSANWAKKELEKLK